MKSNVELIPTRVNLDSMISFYNSLVSNFSHLRWEANLDKDVEPGVGGHVMTGVYGWALQSNKDDLTIPCPPYNITLSERKNYRDTDAMHGYVMKIKEYFPFAHQFSIAAHPPGTKVNIHKDSDDFLKIHIPIFTNEFSYFLFEDEKYNFKADGSMYLVNTDKPHGTLNEGNSTRIHMFFKIPKEYSEEILKYSQEIIC
jgi:hypothetical protein